ncbi:MAG: sugar ABC transporter ATP-binding protein [Propionibacteriaceae bacterium]|jgi:ribose transport system ATP-binding protein|nr:sugar ABC transporter ATP-binding protein [Propionibacteriaceae bacterium]
MEYDPTLLLQVEDVHKSFPGVNALSGMRLDLRHGEVLGLVGENGAGKSTLMKLLTGIYIHQEGEFFLDGEPLRVRTPLDAEKRGLSIIHQELNLVSHLTVAENIWLGREPRSGGVFTKPREQIARTRDLLERLEMDLDPKALVANLTVAKQQMVEIAKALSFDAKVLIMDEPTSALNETEVAQLHTLIRRFVTPETGVVYITHRMPELKSITDRITVIRDGKYITTTDTATSTLDEIISHMVGRAIDTSAKPVNVRDDREVILSVRNLTTKSALHEVSFDLHKGEVLGFAGLMGAGRTETARAIIGADPHVSAEITLRGTTVTISNPAQAARMGIGYLSEDRKKYGLMLNLDVAHNVTISSIQDKFTTGPFEKKSAIRQAAQDAVELLKVKTPSMTQQVKFLSGGNQQKAIIGRWLVKDCDVLIFDEPTRGIDVGAKEEIYQLLNHLAEQGKSIIMISSELPEILRMAHRVVVMSDGYVTGTLQADEATQESIMALATTRLSEKELP